MHKLLSLILLLLLAISLAGQSKMGGSSKMGGNARGGGPSGFTVPSSFTWAHVTGSPDFAQTIATVGSNIYVGTRSRIPDVTIGGMYVSANNGTSWSKLNAGLKSRIAICGDWPTCTSAPSGGTFTLTYNSQTTGTIAFNASIGTIQTALTGLSSVGSGNAVVTDGPIGGATFATITFQGARANDDPTDITLDASGLTGTTPGGMIRGPRHITNMFVTPSNTILVGVRNNLSTDLYRLTSGGTTWQAVGTMTNAGVFWDCTDDGSGNILCVNTVISNNVLRSTDDGATFSSFATVDAPCFGGDERPTAIFHAASSIAPAHTLFVGPHNDVLHYSTDGGATWTCMGVSGGCLANQFAGISWIRLNGSGQMISGGEFGQVSLHTGSWASPSTWACSYLTGESETTHDLIKLVNNDLIIHGKRPYRSTDGGSSWTLDDAGIPAGDVNNPDGGGSFSVGSHTLVVGPDKKLWMAIVRNESGWGVYRTTAAVAP